MEDIAPELGLSLSFLDTHSRFTVLACSKRLTKKILASRSDAANFELTATQAGGSFARSPWLHAAILAASRGAVRNIDVDLRALDARSQLQAVLLAAPTPHCLRLLKLSHGKLDARSWQALHRLATVDELTVDNVSILAGALEYMLPGGVPNARAEEAAVQADTVADSPMWQWAPSVKRLYCTSSPWLVVSAPGDTYRPQYRHFSHGKFRVPARKPRVPNGRMLSHFSGLQHADLSAVDADTMVALQGASALSSLVLRDTRLCPVRGVTTAYADVLARLESLTLDRCFIQPRHVTDQPGHGVITEILCLTPQLRSLAVTRCIDDDCQMTGSNLNVWAGVLSQLAEGLAVPAAYKPILKTYGHSIHAAAEASQAGAPPGPKLQSLTLCGLQSVSARDLVALASALGGSMHHLHLSVERRVEPWGRSAPPLLLKQLRLGPGPAEWATALGHLYGLQSLHLTDLPGLDDTVLRALPHSCPALRQVHLSVMCASAAEGHSDGRHARLLDAFQGPTQHGIHALQRELHAKGGHFAVVGVGGLAARFDAHSSSANRWAHAVHTQAAKRGADGIAADMQSQSALCAFGCDGMVHMGLPSTASAGGASAGAAVPSLPPPGQQQMVWEQCMLDHAQLCPAAPLRCTHASSGVVWGAPVPVPEGGHSHSVQLALGTPPSSAPAATVQTAHAKATACEAWVPRREWARHCMYECSAALWQCTYKACARWVSPGEWHAHVKSHVASMRHDVSYPGVPGPVLLQTGNTSAGHSSAVGAAVARSSGVVGSGVSAGVRSGHGVTAAESSEGSNQLIPPPSLLTELKCAAEVNWQRVLAKYGKEGAHWTPPAHPTAVQRRVAGGATRRAMAECGEQ